MVFGIKAIPKYINNIHSCHLFTLNFQFLVKKRHQVCKKSVPYNVIKGTKMKKKNCKKYQVKRHRGCAISYLISVEPEELNEVSRRSGVSPWYLSAGGRNFSFFRSDKLFNFSLRPDEFEEFRDSNDRIFILNAYASPPLKLFIYHLISVGRFFL